jgi:predicted RND superfamily exporter protein
MTAYLRFILRWRWPVLIAVILLTAASGMMITKGVVASSIGGLFLNEHADYHRYLNRVSDFGSDDVIIVAIEEKAVLSPGGRKRLQQASEKISELPFIRDVQTVLKIQQIQSIGDTLDIHTYADKAEAHPENEGRLLQELIQEASARGLLISADGKHTAVIVELDNDAMRPTEATPELIDNIIDAFLQAGYSKERLHIVGLSANIGAVMEETYFSIRQLFPFVLVVLLIFVWIMFRRFWPVAITSIVSLIGVTWTMAFSIMLDRHVSVFSGMIPPIILIISFSDVIHLCSAYLIELDKGKTKTAAIFDSCREVGIACMFTSITTFAGFVSLSFIPTPATRILGISLGVGAAAALLLAVTLSPILFSLMPAPKTWRKGASGRIQGWLDRLLAYIAGLTARRPKAIVLLFILFFGVIFIGLVSFTIETDFARRMDENHPLRVDSRYFNRHFAGANTLDIYIKASQPEGLMDPSVIKKIAQYQRVLEKFPEINRAYSLVDLIEKLHKTISPQDASLNHLPVSRQAIAQYLLLFEMSGGTDLDRLVDYDYRILRLMVHLPKEEYRHTAAMGLKASRLAPEILGDAVEVEVSGLVYLLGQYFDVILENQRRALIFAFGGIALMMMAGLRSVRVGMWSMIPNLLPLLTLFGYLGLFADYVDSDVLIVALIAIGIGVDDTIHFLMRLRIESSRHHTVQKAIQQTFFYSGRGIVMTTLILAVGFAPFALADYLSIRMLGTLLPLTLIVALMADLFLVPALVKIGAIRFKGQPVELEGKKTIEPSL